MISLEKRTLNRSLILTGLVIAGVLLGALLLGMRASLLVLAAMAAGLGMLVLLVQPGLSLPALVVISLLGKANVPTGTEVLLNPASLMVPMLTGILLVSILTRRTKPPARPRVLLPMSLLLIAGLISMLIGNVTWDPFVPRRGNLVLVQLAQMAIYGFAFIAFWLVASLGRDNRWLKWMTAALLVVGGALGIAFVIPSTRSVVGTVATVALIRAPFWTLLTGVAGGQLFFNRDLSTGRRIFVGVVLFGTIIYSFGFGKEAASNWVGVGSAVAILAWLRFKRLRWPVLVTVVLLMLTGMLFPTVWNFAGGNDEWVGSGQSRLVLIERVLSVSMRNPVTGLGPVAYRSYAGATPLAYQRAFWLRPEINAHNNYVDIFAQFGLVGMGLFIWMVAELAVLGIRLLDRYPSGFPAGYVRGVLAAGGGALVIMMLADWILPFVYNISFDGFQASVMVWLFLGGLAALGEVSAPDRA